YRTHQASEQLRVDIQLGVEELVAGKGPDGFDHGHANEALHLGAAGRDQGDARPHEREQHRERHEPADAVHEGSAPSSSPRPAPIFSTASSAVSVSDMSLASALRWMRADSGSSASWSLRWFCQARWARDRTKAVMPRVMTIAVRTSACGIGSAIGPPSP